MVMMGAVVQVDVRQSLGTVVVMMTPQTPTEGLKSGTQDEPTNHQERERLAAPTGGGEGRARSRLLAGLMSCRRHSERHSKRLRSERLCRDPLVTWSLVGVPFSIRSGVRRR